MYLASNAFGPKMWDRRLLSPAAVPTRRSSLPFDVYQRPLRSLRVSVTDRCNLRCGYCMPEEDYIWLPKPNLLSFEEIDSVVRAFTTLGVDKVRITGGEPLLRQDLPTLIGKLKAQSAIQDLALTTNGVLLERHAQQLADAGLDRITVSLDTLDPGTFQLLTRRNDLARVLKGIEAARAAGLGQGLKIDTVVIRGVNGDQLAELLRYGREVAAEVRFIEYMDVGGATRWSMDRVVSRREMLASIAARLGDPKAVAPKDTAEQWAPADGYMLPDGTRFGIISSTTEPFCGTCDRSRLTADGRWFTCLYARDGEDLRGLIRGGMDEAALARHLQSLWSLRRDRGAEQRLAMRQRDALADPETLRQDPHLEMHTRGG